MKVDAVVNTANHRSVYASGVDTAIYKTAGEEELLAARREIGEMEEGEVAITPGFKLPAKFIIHTVSPLWLGGDAGEEEKLSNCYSKSLALAKDNGCESIAFPLIASGGFGYPKDQALSVALREINSFLMKEDMEVYLVVFDKEAVRLSEKLFSDVDSFIDEHYVQEKNVEEYLLPEEYTVTMASDMPSFDTEFSDDEIDEMVWAEEAEEAAADEALTEAIEKLTAKPDDKNLLQAAMPIFTAAPKVKKRSLSDIMENTSETFQEMLFRLISGRGLSNAEVYKKANLSKKLFSKINTNKNYQPKKETAVALALSLHLSLDETRDLLSRAGLALSPSSKFDLVIQYFIEQGMYDLFEINIALFDHNLPLIGNFD